MAKSLEEDLAEFLLGLARGAWSKQYNRECLKLWREKYGELVASRVEAILLDRWKG